VTGVDRVVITDGGDAAGTKGNDISITTGNYATSLTVDASALDAGTVTNNVMGVDDERLTFDGSAVATATVVLNVSGGEGRDTITGGAGNDTYTLTTAANTAGQTGVVTITDFKTSGADQLALDVGTATAFATRSAITTLVSADGGLGIIQAALTTSQITTDVAAAAAANMAIVVFNSSTGRAEVWYDTDWATTAGREQVATLDNITTLVGVTGLAGGDFALS